MLQLLKDVLTNRLNLVAAILNDGSPLKADILTALEAVSQMDDDVLLSHVNKEAVEEASETPADEAAETPAEQAAEEAAGLEFHSPIDLGKSDFDITPYMGNEDPVWNKAASRVVMASIRNASLAQVLGKFKDGAWLAATTNGPTSADVKPDQNFEGMQSAVKSSGDFNVAAVEGSGVKAEKIDEEFDGMQSVIKSSGDYDLSNEASGVKAPLPEQNFDAIQDIANKNVPFDVSGQQKVASLEVVAELNDRTDGEEITQGYEAESSGEDAPVDAAPVAPAEDVSPVASEETPVEVASEPAAEEAVETPVEEVVEVPAAETPAEVPAELPAPEATDAPAEGDAPVDISFDENAEGASPDASGLNFDFDENGSTEPMAMPDNFGAGDLSDEDDSLGLDYSSLGTERVGDPDGEITFEDDENAEHDGTGEKSATNDMDITFGDNTDEEELDKMASANIDRALRSLFPNH